MSGSEDKKHSMATGPHSMATAPATIPVVYKHTAYEKIPGAQIKTWKADDNGSVAYIQSIDAPGTQAGGYVTELFSRDGQRLTISHGEAITIRGSDGRADFAISKPIAKAIEDATARALTGPIDAGQLTQLNSLVGEVRLAYQSGGKFDLEETQSIINEAARIAPGVKIR